MDFTRGSQGGVNVQCERVRAAEQDPEGEIEKLLETVEEATGEQALATIN